MKTNALLKVAILSGIAIAPVMGWLWPPTPDESGWYYAYDDEEENPPFTWPELPPLPTYEPIWNNPLSNKIEPLYNDRPYQFTLSDSFWYFGRWYEPGDRLYISWDGWVSFDESSSDGFPLPPDIEPTFPNQGDPNDLIAPLWQDNDVTLTPAPSNDNRLYVLRDDDLKILKIEWHNVKHAETENTYDFMLTVQLGGQELLEADGCGVFYSGHLIHFLYNTSNAGWDADGGATGLENYTGDHGITYGGVIENGRVIRMGYRKILDADYVPIAILSPESVVEPEIPVEPRVVLANIGKTVVNINSVFNIYDRGDTVVYREVLGFYEPIFPDERDTIYLPLWTPGKKGEHYVAEILVASDEDQCRNNDTLRKTIWSGEGVGENKPPSRFELKVAISLDKRQIIEFSLPYGTTTEIATYDVNGSKVRLLTDNSYPTGTHTITWDGLDAEGNRVAKGVYIIRMEADGWSAVRKVIIVN